jgi:hypothetical protein
MKKGCSVALILKSMLMEKEEGEVRLLICACVTLPSSQRSEERHLQPLPMSVTKLIRISNSRMC